MEQRHIPHVLTTLHNEVQRLREAIRVHVATVNHGSIHELHNLTERLHAHLGAIEGLTGAQDASQTEGPVLGRPYDTAALVGAIETALNGVQAHDEASAEVTPGNRPGNSYTDRPAP